MRPFVRDIPGFYGRRLLLRKRRLQLSHLDLRPVEGCLDVLVPTAPPRIRQSKCNMASFSVPYLFKSSSRPMNLLLRVKYSPFLGITVFIPMLVVMLAVLSRDQAVLHEGLHVLLVTLPIVARVAADALPISLEVKMFCCSASPKSFSQSLSMKVSVHPCDPSCALLSLSTIMQPRSATLQAMNVNTRSPTSSTHGPAINVGTLHDEIGE